MNCYGTPNSPQTLRSKFERALAAAKASAGNRRQGYLNDALHTLHRIEHENPVELLELAPRFVEECSTEEHRNAIVEELALLQADADTHQPAINLVVEIRLRNGGRCKYCGGSPHAAGRGCAGSTGFDNNSQ